MEIKPATLAQVRAGRDGRRVLVEEDVLDIARRLTLIDDSLSLHWNENGEYFVVVQTDRDGREHLVTTAQELDGRLLDRILQLVHPSYDLAGELDRLDAESERAADWRFREKTGAVAEKLAHALRKDVEAKNRVFLPRGV
jgi:hypothetical protein